MKENPKDSLPGLKQRAKAFLKSSLEAGTFGNRLVQLKNAVKYIVWGSFWIAGAAFVIALIIVAKNWGGAKGLIQIGEKAAAIEAAGPWTRGDEVPYAVADTNADGSVRPGAVKIEKMKVLEPETVEAVVALDGGEVKVLLRRRSPWFPEFRSPSAQLEAEIVGEGRGITFMPTPRPFLEASPRVLLGAGQYTSADPKAPPALYVGLDLLRLGPVHLQGGLVGTAGLEPALMGRPVDVAPGAGIELKENLMLTGAYTWYQGEPYVGVSYAF